MPSFQAMVLAKSSDGFAVEIPSALLSSAAAAIVSYSPAAWIRALEGMQPTLRQVPPGFAASTMIVSMPSWPARIAQV